MTDGDALARMFYLILLLAALAGWGLAEFRGRMGQGLRMAVAWGTIFVAVMAGYGLWSDLRLDMQPRQLVAEGGAITLPRAPDGHYYLRLDVGGTAVDFLVDTGATNVVLSRDDARRLGFNPEALVYTGTASTANGTVRTARVTLPEVVVGPYTDDRVAAHVNDGEMEGSLLGMDYLRLYRIEIDGNRMVLRR
jgi:aspartyl protease family protein